MKLRQLEAEDLPQVRDWRNREDIRKACREYRLLNMVNQRDWFEAISRDRDTEMFAIEANGGLVGICGLCYINWKDRHAEVSIYVGDTEQREKGLGAEVLRQLWHIAFREYGLHRVWAEIYVFNGASIKLFETGGFKQEGHLREVVWWAGEHCDSYIYSLLDYEALWLEVELNDEEATKI